MEGEGNTMIYFHFAKFPSFFWPWAMPEEKAKRRWEDKWKQLLLFPCASWLALCKHVLATLPHVGSQGDAQACLTAAPIHSSRRGASVAPWKPGHEGWSA